MNGATRLGALCLPLCCALACQRTPSPSPPPPPTTHIPPPPAAVTWPGPALKHARTSGGLQVTLARAPEDAPLFHAVLMLPRGLLDEGDAPVGTARLASRTWQHAGARNVLGMDMDPAQLSGHALASGMGLTVEASLHHVRFSVDGPVDHAAHAVTLLCALAFRPWVDDGTRDAAMADVEREAVDRQLGDALLADEVVAALAPGTGPLGRVTLPHPELLDETAVDAWMRDAAVTDGALLLVFTRVDNGVVEAAETCRSEAPAGMSRAPVKAPSAAVHAAPRSRPLRVAMVTEDADNAFVRTGGAAPAPGTAGQLALDIALTAVASGFSSALVQELRTRRGLVYGVDALVSGNATHGMFTLGTSVRPQNAMEVATALEDAVVQLGRTGLPAARWTELQRARALSFAASTETAATVTAILADAFALGRGPAWAFGRAAEAWRLDGPATWPEVAAHLQPGKLVTVVVGPASSWTGPPADLRLDVRGWGRNR